MILQMTSGVKGQRSIYYDPIGYSAAFSVITTGGVPPVVNTSFYIPTFKPRRRSLLPFIIPYLLWVGLRGI